MWVSLPSPSSLLIPSLPFSFSHLFLDERLDFEHFLFVVAFGAGTILKFCADALERMGIDDAVGAVTVHGTIGIYGMLMFGIWGSGLPALQGDPGVVQVTFIGQLVGSVVFILLGDM